jgi:hypothetical protein
MICEHSLTACLHVYMILKIETYILCKIRYLVMTIEYLYYIIGYLDFWHQDQGRHLRYAGYTFAYLKF